MSPNNCADVVRVKAKICDSKVLLNGNVILLSRNDNNTCLNSIKNNISQVHYEKHKVSITGLQSTSSVLNKANNLHAPNTKLKDVNNLRKNCDNYKLDNENSFTNNNIGSSQCDCKTIGNDQELISDDDDDDECSESEIEKLKRSKCKRRKRWWATGDALVSGVVVCTLGVGSWRGLWGLMDLHPHIFPIWPSTFLGISVHLIFTFLRGPLHKHMSRSETSRVFNWWRTLVGRVYCWLFMCACVLQWRSQWELWMIHVVPDPSEYIPLNSQLATWTGFCALFALRSIRNLLAMPYFIAVDTPESTYNFVTRFRTSSREPLLFVLDCIFSVVVVGSLVVFVWRGAWDLLDYYLYPDNRTWSAWSSAVLGYGLAIFTFLLQPLARRACSQLQAARRLLLADLFLFISFLATINVWRSVWMLLDIYFIPENPLLSNWITHGGCLILLMLLNCANSVMVRGVYIDAEEDGGQCVVFPCYYLRLYFQKERAKKRQRRLEKVAEAAIKGDLDSAECSLVTKVHSANHVMVPIPEVEPCLE